MRIFPVYNYSVDNSEFFDVIIILRGSIEKRCFWGSLDCLATIVSTMPMAFISGMPLQIVVVACNVGRATFGG